MGEVPKRIRLRSLLDDQISPEAAARLRKFLDNRPPAQWRTPVFLEPSPVIEVIDFTEFAEEVDA